MSSTGRIVGRLSFALLLCGTAVRPAHAEQVYRYVDERGVVHLTNVPADDRYRRYSIGSAGGSGRGVLILARRDSGRAYIPGLSQRAAYTLTSPRDTAKSPAAYDELIVRAARRHGLPPALVKAVVKAESNFQPTAISEKGARGLMQLMPDTADDLGVEDAFRPEDNVQGGTRYLREMYDRFGDWENALAAYNAGPGAVDRFGGVPPYAETQEYVERVLHYYRRYDGEFSR